MKKLKYLILSLLITYTTNSCKKAQKPTYTAQKSIITENAMVVSAHPLASEVGKEILEAGGNATDAIVAVQFALAVVYPRAGNIGGGGFLVIRDKDGTVNSLDYREKAPKNASKDMYLDDSGNVIDGLSRYGGLAVGVPGSVDGLFTMHEKYGKIKDIKKLIEPAIQLAKNGYQLSITETNRLNRFQEDFIEFNKTTNAYIKEGGWNEGDLLVQKDLAHTLELIRDNGRKGFYEGEVADKIVAQMKTSKGIISHDDLKSYQSKWRAPIQANYKEYKIISMPPPSSGGIALAQLLKITEQYSIKDWGFHSIKSIHLMAETERRVYADRAKHLGDSDFYDVPQDTMLNEDYLAERMNDFDMAQATQSESIAAGNFKVALESFETTHTSVVDTEGNAAAITTTLNSNFGSKVVVDGAGFFLNNEMDDFSAKPGVPNLYGLIGAEANAVAPEKRMLSSMTPTIIEKDGKLFMVLGAPGGSTIITAVYQVFINVAEYGMNLEDAVNAGRFHHQWLPDEIMIEEGTLKKDIIDQLKELGHKISEKKTMAVIKAIQVMPDGKLHGVGDKRNPDDDVAGF